MLSGHTRFHVFVFHKKILFFSDTLKSYLQRGLIYRAQDLSDSQNSFSFCDSPFPSIYHDFKYFCRDLSLSSFSLCVMLPVLVQEINLKSIHVGIVRYCNVLWGFFLNDINLTISSWAQHFHPFILSFSITSFPNVFFIIYPSTIVDLFSIFPPTHTYVLPSSDFVYGFYLEKSWRLQENAFYVFLPVCSISEILPIATWIIDSWLSQHGGDIVPSYSSSPPPSARLTFSSFLTLCWQKNHLDLVSTGLYSCKVTGKQRHKKPYQETLL